MRRAVWLTLLCGLAALLSYGYVIHYLRGGPRIIDATSYWLSARSLATSGFGFEVPEPFASFHGRFLLATPGREALGVIFPPGYPLLLSLGMLLHAPLLVGPALAAALVAATFWLALALGQSSKVAWTAAVLSVVCAALRYHTADTMSHGLATVLACAGLASALWPGLRAGPLLAGLCLGWLAATRPVSAMVSALMICWALRGRSKRAWLLALLGILPGVALHLLQQHALTGSALGSTQLAYYASSDAPVGCFRYGFGANVGCRFEHGDYIAHFMPDGYGAGPALRKLGVQLGLFTVDATNAAPLTLLAGYALLKHRRTPLGLAGAAIALQALAYVPFYFDGNYPGGGARFLCEAIPLCQVLVARALVDVRAERWAVPLALAGFALHARYGHEQLRDREGGRPMFEPDVMRRAGVTSGLVFVDTDHGFNLGHVPGARDPRAELVVARWRGDAHDRALFEAFGQPRSYRYAYDASGREPPRVWPVEPAVRARFESEAVWPADVQRGSAYPIHYPCASAGRALRLVTGTRLRVNVPGGVEATTLEVGWVNTARTPGQLLIAWPEGSERVVVQPGCTELTLLRPSATAKGSQSQLPKGSPWLELEAGQGALDFVGRPAAVP